MLLTSGTLEVTIKVKERPTEVGRTWNGWARFAVLCGVREVTFVLRPRVIAQFDEADRKGTPYVAAIRGRMGPENERGFELEEVAVQVFETKPPKPKPPAPSGG